MLLCKQEFCQQPTLFSDGTTRFDVEQGGAGTCWFLSILSSLADNGEAIKQIIPDDAYPIGSDKYSGLFHCKLWRFGQWVDVYVDDLLPVKLYGSEFKLWGAKSTDDREMWVSLMEKAFARFKGGYANVYGGLPGDAFTTLTGGVAELVEIQDTDAATLYSRMKNALSCGSIITCSCPVNGIKGLVGNHAYTITGTFRINHRAQSKMLLRLRNPWGTKGEWKGDWSDKSYLWNDVTDSVKEKMKVNKKMDGEFWMTMADFMSHFCRVSICNFTPDFDQDGKEDSLSENVIMC
ncbi:hypothetical protein CAPTEDRAFT_90023 [Capitella teleta]|uniref:Calpain catalytic domain-containing protein n=1 Tax=Capitella teleta TaxID=283909 RepID=R7UNL8_CAPTE|nr:hypothetical protein CAPTEDRAFT_90023 [Capitella teleta]|eukprot:ELU08109.1 hypothetical protein CAPTEDRAFT_90023 [Capitella teleta]